MKVISGITPTAPKMIIHGLSGVGKSTLASKLKRPIFLDMEGGLNYLDVPRTPQITSYAEFYTYAQELKRRVAEEKKPREYDTIVIDSVDWLMRKVVEKACGMFVTKDGKTTVDLTMTLNRSNGGYGNGKQVLENEVRTKLLPYLVQLNKCGYGICLIAHSERKALMDADGLDVDRIAPKIDVNTMNVFVEWCDNVFYLKKVGDKRILVLDGDDNILAKNRLQLTGEVDIDEIDINELLMPKGDKKGEK